MAQAFDHLRNLLRREAPACERLDGAPPTRGRGKPGVPRPGLLDRSAERFLFLLEIAVRQRRLDRLAGKAARLKLLLDPPDPVTVAAEPHRGPGGAELVEPSLTDESFEREGYGAALETAGSELASELLAPPRAHGQKFQRAVARRFGGGRVAGGNLAAEDLSPAPG